MDFVILPYQGVGPIYFGMSRSEIHSLFGTGLESFEITGEVWESFHELGIQICYGQGHPYLCRAVMLENPVRLIFQNRNLLDGTSIEELQTWFRSMDESIEIATEGVISYKFGIYLSTQDYSELNQEPPETVTVFERGYYDGVRI